MEHLDDYIKDRKNKNGHKFHDNSLWPFLDDHKGKRLKNIDSKDLEIFLKNNDFKKLSNLSKHANQYNISKLGRLLSYIKKRLKREHIKNKPHLNLSKMWITNGNIEKYIYKDSNIPEGWYRGRSNSCKLKVSKSLKKYYNEKAH